MAALMTVAQFRAYENFTANPPTDAKITALIAEWQAWLERATGQYFDSRAATIRVDGTGNDLLQLPISIVSIEYIKFLDVEYTLEPYMYEVYAGRQEPNDDRFNPHIGMKAVRPSLFSKVESNEYEYGKPAFPKGERNIEIKGVFGFLEPDGTPPLLILRALRRLVLRDATTISLGGSSSGSSGGGQAGPLISETTDSHSYTLASVATPGSTSFLSSGDAEADRIVRLYRRPTALGAPRDW